MGHASNDLHDLIKLLLVHGPATQASRILQPGILPHPPYPSLQGLNPPTHKQGNEIHGIQPPLLHGAYFFHQGLDLLLFEGSQSGVPTSRVGQASVRVGRKRPSSRGGVYPAIEPTVLPILHRIREARLKVLHPLPLRQEHPPTEVNKLCPPSLLHLLRLQDIDISEKSPVGINAKKTLTEGEETGQ